jgi:hypothetical protein
MFEFITGLILAAALAYWYDAMRSHERIRAEALRVCRQANLQLLDDTVEQVRLGLRRDAGGRLVFYREYRFEFTDDGDRRHHGSASLLGRRVVQLRLGMH